MLASHRADTAHPAAQSGIFRIGGELPVHRMGFGSMRLTGKGIWGEPRDREECIAVLRRAVDLGITLIDTADSYGPEVAERLIAEALYPYPDDLVVATKGGLVRAGPDRWTPNGRPDHLRAACDGSLRRLRLDRIELYQLHRIDPAVPVDEQLGVLQELQRQGKIRFIGLSEVSVEQIEYARRNLQIVTVQNRYNLEHREHDDVLEYCERERIGFIPWFPLAVGELARSGSPLERAATRLNATPAQVALAWLLSRSPVMLPIPGTSRVSHLEENTRAAELMLSDAELASIAAAGERAGE
ncbi:MAG TPA: aldo/keto reductase [Gemmatimonadaceae bacterium]|nr:aldo/keto reductase [Gemmatimonadaceae bacterium]